MNDTGPGNSAWSGIFYSIGIGGISLGIRKYRTSILIAVTFAVMLSTFWYMQQLAFIIFISLLLQLLLGPLVDRLSRRMPRALAAGLVLSAFLLLAMGVMAVVFRSVLPNFISFTKDFPQLMTNLQYMIDLQDSAFLNEELNALWGELKSISFEALKSSLALLLSTFSRVIDAVIVFFVTFYLLKDNDSIKGYLVTRFPHSDYSRVKALFDRILSALRTYICSQPVICCLSALVVFIYFSVRNLPYASVFAVVSGVAEFVPVLGPTVASAFGTLLTATNGVGVALQTAGFYLLLTQVNHNIVYPTLIGKSLNLHPIAVILGIVLGGELLGAAGMFLAVPFIVICKLVIEDIYNNRKQQKECRDASRWLAMSSEDEQ